MRDTLHIHLSGQPSINGNMLPGSHPDTMLGEWLEDGSKEVTLAVYHKGRLHEVTMKHKSTLIRDMKVARQ